MSKVLIVEDERAIVEILKFNLSREGYETLEALDGEAGLQLARTADPDLILLDVMLPKLDGFSICRQLREGGISTPIIMLTAREEENDKDSAEGPAPSQETPSTGLVLDPDGFAARKNGVLVELTQKEFDLLSFLMAAPDKVFTREELLDKVWNYDYYGDMRTVDVTVRRLREKIEDDPGKPAHILTKRGAGYYFVL